MLARLYLQCRDSCIPDPEDPTQAKTHKFAALLIAVVASILFFYPSFYGWGRQAGSVFDGDTWHALAAQFMASGFYTSRGIFSGIDFFTHNGASEFFLRPNLPVYNPFVLLLSPFLADGHPTHLALMYMSILVVYAFASLYCLHRLCARFLNLDVWLSSFVTVGYVFSIQIVHAIWYMPYALIAWMLPVAVYCGLATGRHRSLRSIVLASLPTFLIYTAGYVPLAVVSVGISAVFIVAVEWGAADTLRRAWRPMLRSLLPCAIATCVAAPLYLGLARYHSMTEIARDGDHSLSAIAYATSELPRNLLRLIAVNLSYPGPIYEFSVFWGLVPLLIVIIYLAQYPSQRGSLTSPQTTPASHRPLMVTSATIYLFLVLVIFGPSSPLSDIFYYFVPIAGYMHIYQRYLLIGHLFLMLFMGVMLGDIVADRRRRVAKVLAATLALTLVLAMHLVGHQPWAVPVISGNLIIEMLFALLFLLGLIVCERSGAIFAATCAVFQVTQGAMYQYSDQPSMHIMARRSQQITFDQAATDGLVKYFQHNSTKAIVKYVDLIPGPQPYVPKNFPWFVANKIKLSSYYGYDWHLGVNYLYRRLMPVTLPAGETELAYRPNWEWARMTGADFVLYQEGKSSNDPQLAEFIDLSDPTRVYHFSANSIRYVVAPLKFAPLPHDPVVFDNGYIRLHSLDPLATVSDFSTNNAGDLTFTVDSSKTADIEYLFWPNAHSHVYLDNREVTPPTQTKDLVSVFVPAGKHLVDMRYRRPMLTAFLGFYLIYGILIIVSVCYEALVFLRRSPSLLKLRFRKRLTSEAAV